jgi:hypothetical protein
VATDVSPRTSCGHGWPRQEVGCLALLGLLLACSRSNPAYQGVVTNADAAMMEDAAMNEDAVVRMGQVHDAGLSDTTSAVDMSRESAIPLDAGNSPDLAGSPGQIMGSIGGIPFKVAAAYRIGRPASASMTVIFLLESAISCQDLAAPGCDVSLGSSQILELHVDCLSAGSYDVPKTASASYQRHTTNPDASGGQIVLERLDPTETAGTFDLSFGSDQLSGSFSAPYCAAGVEP